MSSSESLLIQSCLTERSNLQSSTDTNTDFTLSTNDIGTKMKRFLIPNIEEKLKVKSPQNMTLKMKTKIEDEKVKFKSSHILSTQIGMIFRKDRNGVEIKGSNKKKIKVTFIDSISERDLVEVVNIECIKEFNIVPYSESEQFAKTKQNCSCNII